MANTIDNQVNYLEKYVTENGFDVPRLINDDFFVAIKLCYNNRLYVSAIKLLLSFIDSMSFVAYGESSGKHFQKWLNEFCDMEKIGISSFELWEHRNSMLHMTNLASKQVKKDVCKMLIGYVGELPNNIKLNKGDCGYYNINTLIMTIANGVEKYLKEKLTPDEIEKFVARYDLVVSDSRNLVIHVNK